MNTQHTPLAGRKVFTIQEVAAYLKIYKSKIHYLVSQKKIPHLKVGRNVMITLDHLTTKRKSLNAARLFLYWYLIYRALSIYLRWLTTL